MNFKKTNYFLKNAEKELSINFKPVAILIERIDKKEGIVGIITKTNQLVKIENFKPYTEKNHNKSPYNRLRKIYVNTKKDPEDKYDDIGTLDKKILFNEEIDKERQHSVDKLKLETNFYNVFRNTIRILLNKYENIESKKNIKEIIDKFKKIKKHYRTQLDKMEVKDIEEILKDKGIVKDFKNINKKTLINLVLETESKEGKIIEIKERKRGKIKDIIKELAKDYIGFVDDADNHKIIERLNDIKTCIVNEGEDCPSEDMKKDNVCFTTTLGSGDKKICKLQIPSKSFITRDSEDEPKENEELYYDRMSDELLRYGNIQMFVFREKSFLTLENINYNLRDDEILILESLLDKDYFADIEENKRNDYLKSISYDNLKPSKYLPKQELPKQELPIKIKKKQSAKLRIKE